MNEKCLISILKRFKKDFGIGKGEKYGEQDIIIQCEYDDYVDKDIVDDFGIDDTICGNTMLSM